MNFNQLRYFVAAAQCGSFTKAAERYYITQTAITQQIRSLEDSVGCSLFDRGTRPIQLTPAGQVFLHEAKALLERLDRAMEKAEEASTGIVGTLRIGYIKGYERSDLSAFLQEYHQQRPNVLISCFRKNTDDLAAGLLNGDYDIIFTWDSTNLRSDERTAWREVEQAHLNVAMYPAHPFSQRATLRRADLAGEKMIYMSPSADAESLGDAYFMKLYQEAGIKPDILFRSTDSESILMMVASEEGISILPDYTTRKLTNADNLVFVPLEGEHEVEIIHAIWQKNHTNKALAFFLEQLEQKEMNTFSNRKREN